MHHSRPVRYAILILAAYFCLQIIEHLLRRKPEPEKNMTTPSPRLKSDFPSGVGRKFTSDGAVLPFPGNTIVSHLSPTAPLYKSLLDLYAKLEASHLSSLFTLLPPSSWHMTVFEGVCDQVRRPTHWPRDLPLDTSMETCTSHFTEKLKDFSLGEHGPPYKLRIEGISELKVGIGIHLEFVSSEEEGRLRGLRDRLADVLELRHPQHEVYELHLSMAYLLRHLDDGQKQELTALLLDHLEQAPKEFELGAPEFCTVGR